VDKTVVFVTTTKAVVADVAEASRESETPHQTEV
jgi:hypothetical protein